MRAGFDYTLPRCKNGLSSTWFDNRLLELFINDFTVFPSTVVNVKRVCT